MGLFDKMKEPVVLKEGDTAKKQLAALTELAKNSKGARLERIEREIKLVEAGIAGENAILFELKNSHMPMYILHDLFLEYDGLTAQIDFLVIARRHNYIIECKNLFGNIKIDEEGRFTRTVKYGRKTVQEGIYSPITQNKRHLELIRAIRLNESKGNIIATSSLKMFFSALYRSVVVLANPKTILDAKDATKEVREQVIRGDELIDYIKKTETMKDMEPCSDKDMERQARRFLERHRENDTDYVSKFRKLIEEESPEENKDAESYGEVPLCPKCGAKMVLRTATRGQNMGNKFYGCPNFPSCRGIVNILQVSM